jgi:hypothetical protein
MLVDSHMVQIQITAAVVGPLPSETEMSSQGLARQPRLRNPNSKTKGPASEIQLRLGGWLSSRVWDISLMQAQAGWTFSLRSYKIIPKSHPVWDAILFDNVPELRALLASREISVYDQDEGGRTLFQVS